MKEICEFFCFLVSYYLINKGELGGKIQDASLPWDREKEINNKEIAKRVDNLFFHLKVLFDGLINFSTK